MLRLSVDYTTEPDTIVPGFSGYLDAMTDHCPLPFPESLSAARSYPLASLRDKRGSPPAS